MPLFSLLSLTTRIVVTLWTMYAVIELGGKQYRVAPEQVLYVELTGTEPGKDFDVPSVLMIEDNNNVSIGTPHVKNAKVTAKVIDDVLAPKVTGFKYKAKKSSHRQWGHRQKMQKIQITSIKM